MTIENSPNILFLCVDQWPGKLLGCAGHQEIGLLQLIVWHQTALISHEPILKPQSAYPHEDQL